MKKRVGFVLFMLLALCNGWPGQKPVALELISSLPKENTDVYFKTSPMLSVDPSGNIYAVDNRDHIIYKFDKKTHAILRIGRQGQGPGELMFPSLIYSDENRIYVKDNVGLSIFNVQGNYLSRFRLFYMIISMAVEKETVYLAQAGTPNLISIYDINGNKISSFGSKYSVDYSLYDRWPSQLADYVVNSGKILLSKDHVFFVSTLFADVFKYTRAGNLVSKTKLVSKEWVKKIEEHFFKKGLKYKKKEESVFGFFLDVAFDDGYFYGMVMRNIFKDCPGDIIKVNEKDMAISEAFVFPDSDKAKKKNYQSLCLLKGKDNRPFFVVSLYDKELADHRINIYQQRR